MQKYNVKAVLLLMPIFWKSVKKLSRKKIKIQQKVKILTNNSENQKFKNFWFFRSSTHCSTKFVFQLGFLLWLSKMPKFLFPWDFFHHITQKETLNWNKINTAFPCFYWVFKKLGMSWNSIFLQNDHSVSKVFYAGKSQQPIAIPLLVARVLTLFEAFTITGYSCLILIK